MDAALLAQSVRVANRERINAIVGGKLALHTGAVVVTHTTGSPDLVLELADRAPEGVRVLDMPVSGTPVEIAAGRLTVLAGGDPADLERVRPVLAAYADPIIAVGGLGDAMRVKLGAAELAQSMGVMPADLARVLTHCSGDSYALRLFTRGGAPEQLAMGALPYLAKDINVVREVVAPMGVELGLLGELATWVDAT